VPDPRQRPRPPGHQRAPAPRLPPVIKTVPTGGPAAPGRSAPTFARCCGPLAPGTGNALPAAPAHIPAPHRPQAPATPRLNREMDPSASSCPDPAPARPRTGHTSGNAPRGWACADGTGGSRTSGLAPFSDEPAPARQQAHRRVDELPGQPRPAPHPPTGRQLARQETRSLNARSRGGGDVIRGHAPESWTAGPPLGPGLAGWPNNSAPRFTCPAAPPPSPTPAPRPRGSAPSPPGAGRPGRSSPCSRRSGTPPVTDAALPRNDQPNPGPGPAAARPGHPPPGGRKQVPASGPAPRSPGGHVRPPPGPGLPGRPPGGLRLPSGALNPDTAPRGDQHIRGSSPPRPRTPTRTSPGPKRPVPVRGNEPPGPSSDPLPGNPEPATHWPAGARRLVPDQPPAPATRPSRTASCGSPGAAQRGPGRGRCRRRGPRARTGPGCSDLGACAPRPPTPAPPPQSGAPSPTATPRRVTTTRPGFGQHLTGQPFLYQASACLAAGPWHDPFPDHPTSATTKRRGTAAPSGYHPGSSVARSAV